MPPKKEEKKAGKAEEKKGGKEEKKGGKDKKDDKKEKKEKTVSTKKKKELTEEQLAAAKPSARRAARKKRFRVKLEGLINEYHNILVVKVDNVGSNQMQKVRLALRGKAVILMGKNTMIRKVLRDNLAANPKLEALLPAVYGNVGFVFTNSNLDEVRKNIVSNRVPAAAKSGTFAPSDVIVPPGPTPLDPGQTSFFQALNIPTKISRGAIEIVSEVKLIKKGEKVTTSHVALLTKLDIKPFFYGIVVDKVYENGSVYDAAVLDISQDDLLGRFFLGVKLVAALGLRIGFPSLATIPHSFATGFKFLLAMSLASEYDFEESKKFKEYLANPSAFASAAAPAAGGAAPAAAAAKEEAPVEEEEEDIGLGGGLFGDD